MKNLTPITRKEQFMAKAAGQDVTPPEPITREEMFLSDIAEHEEGQGGGGSLCVTFTADGNSATCDTAFDDIIVAISAGKWVYAMLDGKPTIYQLSSLSTGDDNPAYNFVDFCFVYFDSYGNLSWEGMSLNGADEGLYEINEVTIN